ncbi:MAG: FHA domain-containing protein [Phycisphaerae bacterium]|nr:FHA domain-containing protein [Phycisphaerae bacterium]
MQARLHLIKGNPKGKTVEVPEGTLTVGRAEDSDLIIASTRISRKHCEIVNDAGGLVIKDKGSGNGTYVNTQKITQQRLDPGDEVRIGPLTFVVEIDGVKEGPAGKAAPAAQAAKPRAAKPKPKAPPKKPATPDDILSSLERMAMPPKKKGGSPSIPFPGEPKKKDAADDVLEISDDDLLDGDS